MDPGLIEDAGGVDVILKETWINMPRRERAVIENEAREEVGEVEVVKLPTFDEDEQVPRTMYRVLTKNPMRKHEELDSERFGSVQEGEIFECLREKVLEDGTVRIKCRSSALGATGYVSMMSTEGEPYLTEHVEGETSVVPTQLDLKLMDLLLPFRITGAEQERILEELGDVDDTEYAKMWRVLKRTTMRKHSTVDKKKKKKDDPNKLGSVEEGEILEHIEEKVLEDGTVRIKCRSSSLGATGYVSMMSTSEKGKAIEPILEDYVEEKEPNTSIDYEKFSRWISAEESDLAYKTRRA
jgi:hypothetical protein